jgi:hypothetical protein
MWSINLFLSVRLFVDIEYYVVDTALFDVLIMTKKTKYRNTMVAILVENMLANSPLTKDAGSSPR